MESNLYFLDYQFSDIQRQRILPFLESHAEWIFYQIWFNFWLWLWLVIEMPGWFLLKHRTRLTVFSSFYFFPEIFLLKCLFFIKKLKSSWDRLAPTTSCSGRLRRPMMGSARESFGSWSLIMRTRSPDTLASCQCSASIAWHFFLSNLTRL